MRICGRNPARSEPELRSRLGAFRVIYTKALGSDEVEVVATNHFPDVPNQLGAGTASRTTAPGWS
jgi:hypothetical protein